MIQNPLILIVFTFGLSMCVFSQESSNLSETEIYNNKIKNKIEKLEEVKISLKKEKENFLFKIKEEDLDNVKEKEYQEMLKTIELKNELLKQEIIELKNKLK